MALRREQLYMLKAQGPTNTADVVTHPYYGGMPLEITVSGVKNLIPAASGDSAVRKLIGISVNSSVEDAKYGNYTPYIIGPCVLALYNGATSPFIAGAGDYSGPGQYPPGGAEIYGPYGLGTGLTTGEGKPFCCGSEDAAGTQVWTPGTEVSVTISVVSDTGKGKWTSFVDTGHYVVGKVKSVVTGGGTATTTPDIVEIQFYGSVELKP